MEKLLRYLIKRLKVDNDTATALIDLVVEGEGDYLRWLYGYDKLKWTGIDEETLVERLERPFVYGFFASRVLKSELGDEVKTAAAHECLESIDITYHEGVPAYLFATVKFLLKKEGHNRDHILTLINLGLTPGYSLLLTTMDDEREDIEMLYDLMMGHRESPLNDKIAFLATVLNLRNVSPTFKLKIYDRFLGDPTVPMETRKELCTNAADGRVEAYLGNRLRSYIESSEEDDEYFPRIHFIHVYIPSLPRRSVRWLAQVSADKRVLVDRYFKDEVKGYDEPYQAIGALDICRQHYGELNKDYCVSVLRRALESNRIEIRRLARRYLDELGESSYR